MKEKGKSLHFHLTIVILIGCSALVTAKHHYQKLETMTQHTITIVEKAKRNLTSQLSASSPSTNTIRKIYFGVSDCWNTSLSEDQRLDDDYTRLKILRKYADKLKISTRNYVKENIAREIGNLYRKISRVKIFLKYSKPSYVTKPVVFNFNATTAREQQIIEVSYLATLENNLRLMKQDFKERSTVTA